MTLNLLLILLFLVFVLPIVLYIGSKLITLGILNAKKKFNDQNPFLF